MEDAIADWTDVELVAAVAGVRAPVAAAWLDAAGSLAGLAGGVAATVPGVGRARHRRVVAALELGRRAAHPPPQERAPVLQPEDALAWLQPRLHGLAREELHALFLDRRHRPIACRRLTVGSDRFTVVDPRQVFREALGVGAAALVLAHNHPSGDPTPSPQDHDVTRRVAQAGDTVGVALVDHLVVASEGWTSLRAAGSVPARGGALAAWTR